MRVGPFVALALALALAATCVDGQNVCLGDFIVCPNLSCAKFSQDCAACPAGEYVCPDHATCVAASAWSSCPGVAGTHFDTTLSIAERAAYLVANTDLATQIAQLWNWAPEIYSLYVPAYNWLSDDEHGVKQAHATSFPNGGVLGSTWSVDTLAAVGEAIAVEARGLFNGFVNEGNRGIGQNAAAGLTLYSPNMNLVRNPLWGRAQEVYSEDPQLSAGLVAAFVKGIQQRQDNGSMLAVACCKHYVAYDLESIPVLRYFFDAQVDARNFWETYMPVFRACVVDAAGQSVMSSYNAMNGVPTTADPNLLNGVLRGRWNFSGFVVSDYDAAANVVLTHQYVSNFTAAANVCWNAGLDQEGGGTLVIDALGDAVAQGLVSPATVATSFARLMTARLNLGLFDPPTAVAYNTLNNSTQFVVSAEHVALAKFAAQQGTCLYKNHKNVLPLDAEALTRIALIGPQGPEMGLLQGNYAVLPDTGIVSVLEGLGAYLSGENESATCSFEYDIDYFQPGQAGIVAESPEVCCSMCSWAVNCSYWTWYQGQCYFKESTAGRQTSLGRVSGAAATVGSAKLLWSPGCNDVGCENESGIAAAVELAASADVIIVTLGLNQSFECEGMDRTTLDFPQGQYDLVAALKANTNVPIIGVLIHGGTMAFGPLWDQLDAIVDIWYPGAQGGNALASVLFGDYNPAGRAPVTYYAGDWQLQPMGEMDLSAGLGTTYRYFTGEPVVPFGFGLSYTTFNYSNLVVADSFTACDDIVVTVTVANTGDRDGDEVVQLYVVQPEATVPTTNIRLAAFARVNIPAKTSTTVALTIEPYYHSVVYNGTANSGSEFWDATVVVEAGPLQIYVGGGQPKYFEGHLSAAVTILNTQAVETCPGQSP
eukprot:a841981_43.p1 GENE.a841981_43~~a841981_43.p1  ORF type:complete len:887 (-),score=386.87 a841981_43:100-2733(-)